MKTLTVALIGHKHIKDIRGTMQKMKKALIPLIEEENAETFLFGSNSGFNDICHMVVTELKQKFYPLIKRVYVRSMYEKIDEDYRSYLLNDYEDTFFPCSVKGAGYRSYVKRNEVMIDMCDILVTYYDKDYKQLAGRMSGTKNAVEYALKKKKRIINLYEQD